MRTGVVTDCRLKTGYPRSVLLPRGEPWSTVRSIEKHALLSCPKRVEKTVSKSHDFSVTESVEVQADGFWLWVLFGGPYTDLSDPSSFQGPLC